MVDQTLGKDVLDDMNKIKDSLVVQLPGKETCLRIWNSRLAIHLQAGAGFRLDFVDGLMNALFPQPVAGANTSEEPTILLSDGTFDLSAVPETQKFSVLLQNGMTATAAVLADSYGWIGRANFAMNGKSYTVGAMFNTPEESKKNLTRFLQGLGTW